LISATNTNNTTITFGKYGCFFFIHARAGDFLEVPSTPPKCNAPTMQIKITKMLFAGSEINVAPWAYNASNTGLSEMADFLRFLQKR
jgi:hypothetical protein